jgi:transposase
LEAVLASCRQHGLLKAHGRQRTDSTHILAAVHRLGRLEVVGETVREVLNVLAVVAPDWLQPRLQPTWEQRYGRRLAEQHLPPDRAARAALARLYGADGYFLLEALWAPETPAWLCQLPAVETLRRVWLQNYYREDGPDGRDFRWREAGETPPAPQYIQSPHDPEARYSQKRSQEWVGYKVHWTETCDADAPRLITDVLTTPAPVPDQVPLEEIQTRLAARDLLPAEQLVDAGYLDGHSLVTSEARGVQLIGPPPANTSWQARRGTGYGVDDFEIDWVAKTVRCPHGERSAPWRFTQKRGQPVIQVQFPRKICAACPARLECTQAAKGGRLLSLLPEAEYKALRAARQQEETPAHQRKYRQRAGIEGTQSQAVRRCGVRRCRYLGEAKTRLQHIATAAALNILRAANWLQGKPLARTRQDAFVRLLLAGAT